MVVVMLIQQMLSKSVGTINDLPASLLASLTVGQRVDAVVLTAAMMAEIVKLRVANTMMELKTPIPLKQGQTVQLELVKVGDKLVLQLVTDEKSAATTKKNAPLLSSALKVGQHVPAETNKIVNKPVLPLALKAGQQVSVEVVKVLADKRILVTATGLAKPDFQQQPSQSSNRPVSQSIAKQTFEIDISRLNSTFKPNDKLQLEVVKLNPLSINLKADNNQRNSLVLDKIRQLLPQQPTVKASMDKVVNAHQQQMLPEAVVKEFRQLLQHVLDKPAVVKPEAFRQAIQNSGVFLERQLLTNPTTTSSNDFKANLLRLISALETVITKSNQIVASDSKLNLKTLPAQVQSALEVLAKTPQDLSRLPAQIHTALASTGKTPTQLLSILVASINNLAGSSEESKAQVANLNQLLNKPDIASADKLPAQTRVLAAELVVLRELLREVEGVHAKLQFNQLSMLKDPDLPNAPNVWLLDLPLKDKERLEMLQLSIEQHQRQQEDDEDIWNVQLTLDTRNLGPLQATINMHAEDITVMLCAERPESAALLEENLDILNADLAKLGVNINHLSCRCGDVAPMTVSASNFYQSQSDALVDISV